MILQIEERVKIDEVEIAHKQGKCLRLTAKGGFEYDFYPNTPLLDAGGDDLKSVGKAIQLLLGVFPATLYLRDLGSSCHTELEIN